MLISTLISVVVLALFVAIIIWLLRYLGTPDIIEKIVIVLAVLIALSQVLAGFGVIDGYHPIVRYGY